MTTSCAVFFWRRETLSTSSSMAATKRFGWSTWENTVMLCRATNCAPAQSWIWCIQWTPGLRGHMDHISNSWIMQSRCGSLLPCPKWGPKGVGILAQVLSCWEYGDRAHMKVGAFIWEVVKHCLWAITCRLHRTWFISINQSINIHIRVHMCENGTRVSAQWGTVQKQIK